jgi:hypothetical protein
MLITYQKNGSTNTHVTSDMSHMQNPQKNGLPTSSMITTVVMNFSSNIPITMLRGHPLHPRYQQLKEQYLYGRGVFHVCTGEGMSSPP